MYFFPPRRFRMTKRTIATGTLGIAAACSLAACRSQDEGTGAAPGAAGAARIGAEAAAGEASPEDLGLAALFDEYLEFVFRTSPSAATALGDHRFDSEIDDLSPAALKDRDAGNARFLERFRSVDRAKLSASGRADLDIVLNDIEGTLFGLRKLRPFEKDPLIYSGLATDPIYGLVKRDYAPMDERTRNVLARMRKLPAVLAAARANLKDQPKPHVEVAIRQNRGAIAFYDGAIGEFVKGSAVAGEIIAEGKSLAGKFREYGEWLEKDLLPRATGDWRIGRALWEEKLRHSLNSALKPEEILSRAGREYDRVRAEMLEVAKALWPSYFPGTPPPSGPDALDATVRAVLDEIALEHSTRESIVGDVKRTVEDLRRFLREKPILALPEPDRCEIIVMPEFQAGISTAYLDSAPPLEPAGRSFFAIEPMPASAAAEEVESRLREYNLHMLVILAIHEGYPGHYVQLEYSNRFPSKIRKVLGNGPFIEGWAVYTEKMMVESGFAGGDPRLKLSRLKFYLRAVVNARIDQGLHAGGMTESEALDLMMKGAFQEENEAKSKLVRAQVTSTQLSTYFVGFQEVQSLREEVEKAEGPKFSLERFHERLLSLGSPPVRVVREAFFPAK
jgi:uncharacterized protein (DUF885 family)